MTLGVPKVAYTFYDEDRDRQTIWIDIYQELFQERLLLLCGLIDNNAAVQIIALIIALADMNNQDIYIYISSTNGDSRAGISIYDTITTMRPDTCTLVMGFAASAASLVLAGGTRRRRVAFPHARVMIHQAVMGCVSKPADTMTLENEMALHLYDSIVEIYADTTGKDFRVIEKDLEREKFMSADEAQAYGIVDHVSRPQAKKDLDISLEQEKNRSFF